MEDDEFRDRVSSLLSMGPEDSWVRKRFTPKRAVYILTFVLFLNYVDRGIVTGSANSIKGCVADISLCGYLKHRQPCPGRPVTNSTCDQCRICGDICDDKIVTQSGFGINSTNLGVLQSMFMVGYVVGALFFGHMVNRVAPFKLISLGLFLWSVASFGSGLAGYTCDTKGGAHLCVSYYFLLAFRALSGVAEASLNTLSLPFLDDILDPSTKGFYIGIYYAAIPCGTAFGVIWSGIIADATGGHWEWAFLLQAPIMLPFALLSYSVPFRYKIRENFMEDDGQSLLQISLAQNIFACLRQPAFVFGILGYAMYTGVVAGLGFYGPIFIQDYRPCDSNWDIGQSQADSIFGIVIGLSGLVGTIIGAQLVDRIASDSNGRKNKNALVMQLILQLGGGLLFSLIGINMLRPVWFFAILFIGSCFVFMVSTGINLMLMWTVPRVNRPMANSLTVFAIHSLGDVPSPILIGYISDHHTPLFTLSITLGCILFAMLFWFAVLFVPVNIPQEDIDFDIDDSLLIDSYTSLE